MGSPPGGCGFPAEVSWLRTSGDGAQKIGGKKYKGNSQKGLNQGRSCAIINICDIPARLGTGREYFYIYSLLPDRRGPEDQKEVQDT